MGISIYLNQLKIPSLECPYYPEPRAGVPPATVNFSFIEVTKDFEALQTLVKEQTSATLVEYQKLFLEKTGMVTRTPTLCRKLKGLKDTYKKTLIST